MTYNMNYIPRYFAPHELVPLEFVKDWFYLMDDRLLRAIDLFRIEYGVTIINNYGLTGTLQGNIKLAGWRPMESIGAAYSQHKWGRAGDLKPISDPDPPDVLKFVKAKLPDVTTLLAYPWGFHLDVRNAKRMFTNIT